MERNLASIQRILKIEPIPGADSILKAVILGWELVIAKKDKFEVGDLVIYVEIDSILPDRPEFEFMRERKFRVKTIKLRGQVSQGICFPLSILPKGSYNEGDDVSTTVGVKKYDPQFEQERVETISDRKSKNPLIRFAMRYAWFRKLVKKETKREFPPYLHKTDEPRCQIIKWNEFFVENKDDVFQVSEKLDGQSASFFIRRDATWWRLWRRWEFGVCSRNFWLVKPDNSSYWGIAKNYNMRRRMISYCKENNYDLFIIQGEIVGSKIQKNKYHIDGHELYVFNIRAANRDYHNRFDNVDMRNICDIIGLDTVPLIDCGFRIKPTVVEMVEYAKGKSLLDTGVLREGIVVRNYDKYISFKVINPDFLLKNDE